MSSSIADIITSFNNTDADHEYEKRPVERTARGKRSVQEMYRKAPGVSAQGIFVYDW